MLRGSMRPDTSTASMDPGGMWLHSHDVAPPFDKYRTKAITTDSYMTYNSTSKEFVVINMDDFGNYSTSTSPGWNGDTFVWTDKMSNDGGLGVTTMNKKSATEYSFNNVGKDASGKPVPPTNGTCTKSS